MNYMFPEYIIKKVPSDILREVYLWDSTYRYKYDLVIKHLDWLNKIYDNLSIILTFRVSIYDMMLYSENVKIWYWKYISNKKRFLIDNSKTIPCYTVENINITHIDLFKLIKYDY